MRVATVVTSLFGLASSAYAQTVSASQNGLSYSFSVPDTTASSGSGDVYIQISGPTSFGWIGLGSGSQMSGSTMMIIYANAAGNNVTLSPRKASGHTQPSYDSSIQAVLTEGSGISNGVMTANIRCSSCASAFAITSSSAPLIYAAKSGTVSSDSTSASLSQHDGSSYGTLTLDMTKAKNSANDNPFVSSSSTPSSTTTGSSGSSGSSGSAASCVPESQVSGSSTNTATGSASQTTDAFGYTPGVRPTSRPTSFPNGVGPFNGNAKLKRDAAPTSCPAGYVLVGGSSSNSNSNAFSASHGYSGTTLLIAHGLLAGLAFAVIFPLGAISIRLLSFPGLVWFHAGLQILAYLFYLIAFGIGIYMANDIQRINQYHPIIGIIVFVMIFFMPILGWLHHRNFKKYQTRTGVSYAHLWTGRLIIPLGIINGGLGFKFADNTRKGPIIYAIVAAIFFITYVVAVVIGERRRSQNRNTMPPKYDEIIMENYALRDNAPVRHREFYGSDRK